MRNETFDIIVLGTGPAGLQAAIHAAGRNVSVMVLGRLKKSSAYQAHIENFCCICGDTGTDLLNQAHRRAEESGAQFLDEDVTGVSKDDGRFVVAAESGENLKAKALVFAMGVSRNKLGLKGEKSFVGRGISYCVDCDARFYRGASVAVLGNESAAVTGALTLLFYSKEVHLVCEKLAVAAHLRENLEKSPIHIHEGKKASRIIGKETVTGLILDDGTELMVDGVFIELGAKGVTALAGNLGVALDNETMTYISTNKKQETNIAGIYAAGDICGPPWQVAKAVGEGCVAGLEAAEGVRNKNRVETAISNYHLIVIDYRN